MRKPVVYVYDDCSKTHLQVKVLDVDVDHGDGTVDAGEYKRIPVVKQHQPGVHCMTPFDAVQVSAEAGYAGDRV